MRVATPVLLLAHLAHRHSLDLRTQRTHAFDTARHRLLESVRLVVAHSLDVEERELPPLARLHEHAAGGAWVQDGSGNRMNLAQHLWNSRRDVRSMRGGPADAFSEAYVAFVREVAGPLVGGGRLVFQRAPGLRISTPSSEALGKMHCDRDYHHQPAEINFWVPLTSTAGNNSLWVESEPNKGDFAPLTMRYGQVCRFFGNQCRHLTYPNNSNSTRVSFDFRVVSAASGGHDPRFRSGQRRGPKANFVNAFDVGGFYEECDSI